MRALGCGAFVWTGQMILILPWTLDTRETFVQAPSGDDLKLLSECGEESDLLHRRHYAEKLEKLGINLR